MVKIFMEHIPRTIFGVKYNLTQRNGVKFFNQYKLFFSKGAQLKAFDYFKLNPKYSDVKCIRWHINANDEE